MTTRSPVQRARRSTHAVACLALAAGLLAPAAGASAASPKPSLLPPSVEAWLDAPYAPPPDVPPDGRIAVGLTLWNTAEHAPAPMDGVYAKVYPAKGKAKPTSADATQDWPGHLLIEIAPPTGGPGRIELRIRGQDCPQAGRCTDLDLPLPITGTGPPPDAPKTFLVEAYPLPIVGDVVAGRPLTLDVVVQPRGQWDDASLDLPDHIIAIATDPAGADLGSGELRQTGGPGVPYRGQVTIPDVGDADLSFAFPGVAGAVDQVIEGAPTRVHVIEQGQRPDGSTPRPGASGSGIPDAAQGTSEGDTSSLPWIALIGVLVVGVVLMFGGTVRGWLRRED